MLLIHDVETAASYRNVFYEASKCDGPSKESQSTVPAYGMVLTVLGLVVVANLVLLGVSIKGVW